jgi:hypothetical protein
MCVVVLSCQLQYLTGAQPFENDTLFGNPPTYKLLITALVPPTLNVPSILRQSPWAILDVYEGRKYDGDAPQWMQWSNSSMSFYHCIPSFTELFIGFADLRFNADQVGDASL